MIAFALANWKLIVIGLLCAFIGVQYIQINHAHTELAQIKQQYAEERQKAAEVAKKAEQDAREEEQRREQNKQEVMDAAEQRIELAKAAAADADRASASLRDKLAAYIAASRRGSKDPSIGKAGEATSDPLGMLSILLDRLDRRAGVIARFADESRIAGLACEAQYDGLRH